MPDVASPNGSVTTESGSNTVTFDSSSPNSVANDETLEERRSPRITRNRAMLPPPSLGQESEDDDTVVGKDSPDPNYKVDETDEEDDALDVETRHDPILADIRKQLNCKRNSEDKEEDSEDDSTVNSDKKVKSKSNKKQRVDVNELNEKKKQAAAAASFEEQKQVAAAAAGAAWIEKQKQAGEKQVAAAIAGAAWIEKQKQAGEVYASIEKQKQAARAAAAAAATAWIEKQKQAGEVCASIEKQKQAARAAASIEKKKVAAALIEQKKNEAASVKKNKEEAKAASIEKKKNEVSSIEKKEEVTESIEKKEEKSIGKKQSETTEAASLEKKKEEAIDEVTPSTPKKARVVHDTWVNSVVEQFLNSPEGRPPSRTSRSMKLSYNTKEVRTKMKQKKEAAIKEKKEAAKGKRTKKVVTKQLNTMTQCFRNNKNNKNR
jgi:hypothetical protein